MSTVYEIFEDGRRTKMSLPFQGLPGTPLVRWRGEQATAVVAYIVEDAQDEESVFDAVDQGERRSRDGMSLARMEIAERLDATTWKVLAEYRVRNRDNLENPLGNIGQTIDALGQSVHITQSRSTVASYAADGETAPDLGGAIGFDGEFVAGADIIQPSFNFTVNVMFDAGTMSSFVTGSYPTSAELGIDSGTFNNTALENFIAELSAMTGTVNDSQFMQWGSGEVRFDGFNGQYNLDHRVWTAALRFAVSRNRQNFNVGSIVVAEKRGWDYLWVKYTDSGTPEAVYIEQVYPYIGWTLIERVVRYGQGAY